jgi:glycosidase
MTTSWVQFPLIFNFDVRFYLRQLSRENGRTMTLAEVPDTEIDTWSASHFDAVWLLGVWQSGRQSRRLALNSLHLSDESTVFVTDWKSEDIFASPYSIADYRVAEALGGDLALAEFRSRLAERGIKLILDFVPNHTALDHLWVGGNREFYISIPAEGLEQMEEGAYFSTDNGIHLACGRDPNFPAFRDTLQLNLSNNDLRSALIRTLQRIATQCDGVRCDLAMLVLKDVFNRTWGSLAGEMDAEFWDVAIAEVKKVAPDFLFIAEAYWGTEWHLQRLGFDFTYDKTLYERIAQGDIGGVKAHLTAEWEFASKLARFTENHDEARAAEVFGPNNKAASLLTLTLTGLRLMHDGQRQGLRRRPSLFLLRRVEEEPDRDVEAFYDRLLQVIGHPAITRGDFTLLELKGEGSETAIAFQRSCGQEGRIVCAVNLSERASEISFETDAFAGVKDYREMQIVSTEQARTPQLDLWPGGITLRLRGHEGLLFVWD